MTGGSWTQFVLRHRLLVESAFAAVAIVAASIVLWFRQTPDALLRVDSFVGGLAQVTFWALPTVVLYMLLARRPAAIVVLEGCALVGLLVWGWWSYATDGHSTASFGPAGSGWLLGPVIVITVWLLQALAKGRADRTA
jgi:hypothetical protein